MRVCVPMLLAVIVGCGSELQVTPTEQKTAAFALLLPKSDAPWCEELRRGFEDGAKQFQLDYVVRDYAPSTAKAILQAADTLPPLHSGNACIVFTNTTPIKEVVRTLRDEEVPVITIGEDEVMSGRIGHVGESSTDLAYRISIRLSQMSPPPKKVLAVFSEEPVHAAGIKAALFKRSEGWRRFQLRTLTSDQPVPKEQTDWAELIIAVGSKAVDLTNSAANKVIPADGSKTTLEGIRNGTYELALVPDYYQMGYRAVRISREHFVTESITTPMLSIRYKEVDKRSLDWFLKKRYALPPAVRPRT